MYNPHNVNYSVGDGRSFRAVIPVGQSCGLMNTELLGEKAQWSFQCQQMSECLGRRDHCEDDGLFCLLYVRHDENTVSQLVSELELKLRIPKYVVGSVLSF